jgi:hypothetical protein
MEQNEVVARSGSENTVTLARKSWTAYVGPVFFFLVLLGIAIALMGVSEWAALGMGAIALIYLIPTVMIVRSYRLYYDDIGVWVYAGIFPWSKGANGVKWRDLDEALYSPNFVSWLLKSYSLRVGHRFTKSGEIFLTRMHKGDTAAMEINTQHHARLKDI